ncbi:MAG: SAF domain-containing protein [Clostridium paraputrificum]|uniref:SAF domain-containing protein n=1 Tax=Clostridium sp. TaxID=1506 RepID=UPI0025C6BCC6|nr:SAF domain-containing protein [Clostridium sp.]MBS5926214.1 hypothetical protein [Clostridium sp.]
MGKSSVNKTVKRVISLSLISVSGITAFYQYRFSKVEKTTKEEIVVATKEINPGDLLTNDNISRELREKVAIPEGSFYDINNVLNSYAKEHIPEKEVVNENRILTENEYKKKGLRLVSISSKEDKYDTFVGYEVKPYDKVDLLYFDSLGTYEGQVFLEGLTVYDLKSEDGISYKDRVEGYVPRYALFWVEQDTAERIYEKQESGGYFRLVIHRDKDKGDN